jgi:hypothetical protein
MSFTIEKNDVLNNTAVQVLGGLLMETYLLWAPNAEARQRLVEPA